MTNLEQYAEQCAAERLRKRITDDVLSLMEIEDEDLEEILKAFQVQA